MLYWAGGNVRILLPEAEILFEESAEMNRNPRTVIGLTMTIRGFLICGRHEHGKTGSGAAAVHSEEGARD